MTDDSAEAACDLSDADLAARVVAVLRAAARSESEAPGRDGRDMVLDLDRTQLLRVVAMMSAVATIQIPRGAARGMSVLQVLDMVDLETRWAFS